MYIFLDFADVVTILVIHETDGIRTDCCGFNLGSALFSVIIMLATVVREKYPRVR